MTDPRSPRRSPWRPSAPALLVYINGHGFGHATRCLAVLRELWRARPAQQVLIRTDAPGFLFAKDCTGPFRMLPGPVDPGTVQADPLGLDVEASVRARSEFQRRLPDQVGAELRRLRGHRVALVAGDIPPLAFEVARALLAPSIALGNFSWDWIYEPFVAGRPECRGLIEGMRDSYRAADLLLRLPLHGDMAAFRRIEDVPHVARPPAGDPRALRDRLGLGEERRPLVLVSFGGFSGLRFGGPGPADPGPYRFLAFGEPVPGMPPDTLRLPVDHRYRHEELVAACDALITKPGYGTVAECLRARTPFLYTSRDHFREYDVLVEGIRRDARARFVPRRELLGLRWRPHLEALLADRRPWREVGLDGAAVAAGHLLDRLPPDESAPAMC